MANGEIYKLALQVEQDTGIDANFIYAGWAHETNGFTSTVFKTLNNFGGLKQFRKQPKWTTPEMLVSSEGDPYQAFESHKDYQMYFSYYITLYGENGIFEANTVEKYAQALKNGGYYGDTVENYINGMYHWLSILYGGDVQ